MAVGGVVARQTKWVLEPQPLGRMPPKGFQNRFTACRLSEIEKCNRDAKRQGIALAPDGDALPPARPGEAEQSVSHHPRD